MFRRPGKNALDANGTLYAEETSPVSSYKYGTKKSDPHDLTSRLFESSYPTKEERPSTADSWVSETNPSLAALHTMTKDEEEPETTLGEGVSFRGELCFERLLRIDGTFEGTLVSQGKVIIGPKGKVKADLNLREAVIEGEIEGNITVQEKLELRGEAKIRGDLKARSICVDEGVQICGHLHVSYIPKQPEEIGD